MRSKYARRGFSLIEVMIASAVLAIGLLGIVELHRSSIRGLSRGRSMTVANEIIDQRAELITGRDPAVLLTCPTAADGAGCRANSTSFTAAKPCTAWLMESDVPTPAGADVPSSTDIGFRRDVVIQAHPDTTNHSGSFLAIVSVCWRDPQGQIQQLQRQRLLVPGA